MTTPNSREGIEKVLPCIDPHCDNHGTTITVNRDGEPEQMQCEYCYRERFPILDWHHQELQKAREEERKIIKLRIDYDRRKGIPAEETVNDIYDSIELKDQSELDQSNK